MLNTPKGLRLQIGIFGRRNVGKSSFLNALTRQQVSIVSEVAGTTTDPVEKAMELLPIGPVLFIDTAGIDDLGALGQKRVEKTRQIIERVEVAVLIAEGRDWGEFEKKLLAEFKARKVPVIMVFNKTDLAQPDPARIETLRSQKIPCVLTVAKDSAGVEDFKAALLNAIPEDYLSSRPILGDLLPRGEVVVLVVPIDLEAPKGRLILPQVQSIRDALDSNAYCVVVKERELRDALDNLKRKPRLVITDSQAFLKVAADTPKDIPLTSFSILFARFKGDLHAFVEGALAVDQLRPGDRILIAEACAHHPIGEDIGRVKIPRWLTQYVGGALEFVHVRGHDFPEDLSRFRMVVHCGSCTMNRREMLNRILRCRQAGCPISNYGLVIAASLGILQRALSPFPDALELLERMRKAGSLRVLKRALRKNIEPSNP
jgi:[FeFe] hydrogenase H-cluster maturation GTPase HydF